MHSRTMRSTSLWLPLLVLVCGIQTASAATRILTDSDKGGKVVLRDGDQIELRLSSNPSTGYRWSIHPDSTPLMNLVSQDETQSKEAGLGSPIVQIFRFEAVKKGQGVLLLRYARAANTPDPDKQPEKPDPDEQQFDLHITIR